MEYPEVQIQRLYHCFSGYIVKSVVESIQIYFAETSDLATLTLLAYDYHVTLGTTASGIFFVSTV
jgi:hypothetical protein